MEIDRSNIKVFIVKVAISVIASAALGLFIIGAAAAEAEKTVNRLTAQLVEQAESMSYFPGQGNLSAAGERLAESLQQMTPQRREELTALLRNIVLDLRPYAVELLPLFEEMEPDK